MNNNGKFKAILHNDKFALILSLFCALAIWLAVMIYASPETTRVIQGVKVNIDDTVPSQFGLEVFGNKDFTVDVTVKGKKYMISASALSAEDIIVTAQTNSVDSAGKRTLQLKAEASENSSGYSISSLSQKTIEVYFDTLKTVQMVIEPDVKAKGFPIVGKGFTTGDINLSETAVDVSGPSAQVNKIEKIVARVVLDSSLKSNKSFDAELIPLDSKGQSDFTNLTLDKNTVVLTVPVFRLKNVKTAVLFKNAPDSYLLEPLKYKVSPAEDQFKISVDEYEKTDSFPVGTIDFKSISPTNHVFEFSSEELAVADKTKSDVYYVDVDVSGLAQEYITVAPENVAVNTDGNKKYTVSGLNKSVVVVGTEKALESITADSLTVEADLSDVDMHAGQTVTVPAVVNIQSADCWVYGSYTVDITL